MTDSLVAGDTKSPSKMEGRKRKFKEPRSESSEVERKLKGTRSDSSDVDIGEDRMSGSSSWEDQDSSDNARLQITTEPRKKKIRKKRAVERSPRRKAGEVNIPNDVLKECSKLIAMDKRLDDKAKSFNWGKRQVKMVLRAIVKSEEMMNMLRNAGLATGEKQPQAEPKMTRAMTRKVVEAGDTVPWIVNPATPMKAPDKNMISLLTGELQEEEEDDKDTEYHPDMDIPEDDDDDSLFSGGTPSTCYTDSRSSFISTPATNSATPRGTPRSSVATPRSCIDTPEQFKRPFRSLNNNSASRILDFETKPVTSSYSTRSKNPLTEYAIEDIEQQFIPFDITPDMYETCEDNDEYADFLKALYGGTQLQEKMVEEEDPEFVYCQNEADLQTKDPEELRNDKATKIAKKEVAELMAELLQCANGDPDQDEEANKRKNLKKKKTPLVGDQIYETIREHSENAIIKEIANASCVSEVFEVEEETVHMTELEREEVGKQMQQHIQMLTQMSLLSSHNKEWAGVRSQCDQMLSEVMSSSLTSSASSVASQTNLITSLAVVKEWDELGQDPTVITKNKNNKKYKKRSLNFSISDELIQFMSRQTVFYYPLLLPTQALSTECSRIVWSRGEDNLLALAMMNTLPTVKKAGLTELSYALQARYLRAKEATQIRMRIKNLKSRDGDTVSNPVLEYITTGEARPARLTFNLVGNGSQSLKEMLLANSESSDFPYLWSRKILDTPRSKMRSLSSHSNQVVVQVDSKAQVQVVTVPDSLLNTPGRRLIIVNSRGKQLVSLASEQLSPQLATEQLSPLNKPSFLPQPLPAPILCVDGNSNTPTSTSDSDTPDPPPAQAYGLGAGVKKLNKSPFKRLAPAGHLVKSPLKAASDRILKKYSTSPHKRNIRREIRQKPLRVGSPLKGEGAVRRLAPTNPAPPDPPAEAPLPPVSPGLPSPECPGVDLVDSVDTPTTLARRKTRTQREAELTQTLVGVLETGEEREARAGRESREMFDEIRRVLGDSPDLVTKFSSLLASAGELGTVGLYQALHSLLEGHSMVQELLLDLLTTEEAALIGGQVYSMHQQRGRMKRFVLKLGVAYRHQPAYHARVLRELDSLCGDSSLTSETLRVCAVRLFKHNQHLLDEFLLLVPGVEPPTSCLPSPEELQYPEDSDHSWGSDELRPETLVLTGSPEGARGGPSCSK